MWRKRRKHLEKVNQRNPGTVSPVNGRGGSPDQFQSSFRTENENCSESEDNEEQTDGIEHSGYGSGDNIKIGCCELESGGAHSTPHLCLVLSGLEYLPWMSSIASMKKFAEDFPQIRQVCLQDFNRFVLLTNIPTSEDSKDLQTSVMQNLREALFETVQQPSPYACTIPQILWTRPFQCDPVHMDTAW